MSSSGLYKSSVINKSATLINSVGPQSAILKNQYAHTAYLHLNNISSEYRAPHVRSSQIKVVAFFSLARGEGVSENKRNQLIKELRK